MEITNISRFRFFDTLYEYQVPWETAQCFYNYYIKALPMGSFYTHLMANNALSAISHMHPSWSVEYLKNTVKWISHWAPPESRGSLDNVTRWLKSSESTRRTVLELQTLIFTQSEETLMILRGEGRYFSDKKYSSLETYREFYQLTQFCVVT